MQENLSKKADKTLYYLFLAVLPAIIFLTLISNGGMGEATKQLASLALWAMGIIILTRKDKLGKPPSWFVILWFANLLWGGITIVSSYSPALTARWILLNGSLVVLAIITFSIPKDYIRNLLRILSVIFAIEIVIGYAFLLGARLGIITGRHDMLFHFISTFYWKNPAAGFVSMFIPLLFGLWLTERGKWWKAFYLTILFLGFGALILTRSRGAWLTFATSAVIATIFYRKPVTANLWRIILIVIVGFAISSAIVPPHWLISRFAKIEEIAAKSPEEPILERRMMIRMGLRMLSKNPFLGVGAGAFLVAYPIFLESSHYLSSHLHNQYLQYAAEGGFPLMLIFFAALFVPIFFILKKSRKKEDPLLWGIGFGALAYALHIGIDFDWTFWGSTLPFIVILALGTKIALEDNGYLTKIWKTAFTIFCTIGFIASAFVTYASIRHDWGDLQYAPQQRLKSYKASAKLFPLSAKYWYDYGKTCKILGMNDEAAKAFARAIKLEPKNINVIYQYAFSIMRDDSSKAENEFVKAVKLAPFVQPDNQLKAALFILHRGDTAIAESILTSLTKNFDVRPGIRYTEGTVSFRYTIARAMFMLAKVWRKMGKTVDADSLERIAIKLGCPRYKDELAKIWGIDTKTPEWLAMEFVDALCMGDTNWMKEITIDSTYSLLKEGLEVYLGQIYGVNEDLIRGKAVVSALLFVHKTPIDPDNDKRVWIFSFKLTDKGWKLVM